MSSKRLLYAAEMKVHFQTWNYTYWYRSDLLSKLVLCKGIQNIYHGWYWCLRTNLCMYVYVRVCVIPCASVYFTCSVLFSIYRVSGMVLPYLPYLRISLPYLSFSPRERGGRVSRSYWEYKVQNFSSKIPVDFVYSLCTDYRPAYYPLI